jgi:hypothetical protein
METAAWSLLHGGNCLVAVQVIDGALIMSIAGTVLVYNPQFYAM